MGEKSVWRAVTIHYCTRTIQRRERM